MSQFTADQIRDMNRQMQDKTFIVVDGHVLEIEQYKFNHPGGADVFDMKRDSSKYQVDFTAEFEAVGHSDGAVEKMMKFKVGDFIPEKGCGCACSIVGAVGALVTVAAAFVVYKKYIKS